MQEPVQALWEPPLMESAAAELPAIPTADFKAALRGLASSICVITAGHGDLANGVA